MHATLASFFSCLDDPVEKALMLYCAKYLTDGACSNANCSKLHEVCIDQALNIRAH